jgi:hypothetical protein
MLAVRIDPLEIAQAHNDAAGLVLRQGRNERVVFGIAVSEIVQGDLLVILASPTVDHDFFTSRG